MHVDNQYVRQGDIDPFGILQMEDVTATAGAMQDAAAARAQEILAVLDGDRPHVDIGPHCDDPYECPLKEKCWAFLPEHNVLQFYRMNRKTAFTHLQAGRQSIEALSPGDLNDKQRIQQRAVAENQP